MIAPTVDRRSPVDIVTPCSQACGCPEDVIGTPEHDNPPDRPDDWPEDIEFVAGLGHNEFVPHKEDWYRDENAGRRTPDGRRRRRALERCWNECSLKTRLACLEIGLAQGPIYQFGIWGGYTEDQRRQILAARQSAGVQ